MSYPLYFKVNSSSCSSSWGGGGGTEEDTCTCNPLSPFSFLLLVTLLPPEGPEVLADWTLKDVKGFPVLYTDFAFLRLSLQVVGAASLK